MFENAKHNIGKFVSKFTNSNVIATGMILAVPSTMGVNALLDAPLDDIQKEGEEALIQNFSDQISELSELQAQQSIVDNISNSNLTLDKGGVEALLEKQTDLSKRFKEVSDQFFTEIHTTKNMSEMGFKSVATEYEQADLERSIALPSSADFMHECQIEHQGIKNQSVYADEVKSCMNISPKKEGFLTSLTAPATVIGFYILCAGLHFNPRVKKWAEEKPIKKQEMPKN